MGKYVKFYFLPIPLCLKKFFISYYDTPCGKKSNQSQGAYLAFALSPYSQFPLLGHNRTQRIGLCHLK